MISTTPVTKEIKQAARDMGQEQARYLVDQYYRMQDYRKRGDNQVRAVSDSDSGEPVLAGWLADYTGSIEGQIKLLLKHYAQAQTAGEWALSICGIGPVISAGLLAHIDIEQAPTVGHIWRFAGLDPTVTWGKGEKRPWNAKLKTLCWHIGESFVKVSGNDADFYGQLYLRRKEYEQAKNADGDYAEQAAAVVKRVPNHKQVAIYKDGCLPDGHIHARCKRWATKVFLSHFHHVAYETYYGEPPPKPYVLTPDGGGHGHYIEVPNWPMG
jgi:hypothetical protein